MGVWKEEKKVDWLCKSGSAKAGKQAVGVMAIHRILVWTCILHNNNNKHSTTHILLRAKLSPAEIKSSFSSRWDWIAHNYRWLSNNNNNSNKFKWANKFLKLQWTQPKISQYRAKKPDEKVNQSDIRLLKIDYLIIVINNNFYE